MTKYSGLQEIEVILVPQGSEYQSVCQGLSRANITIPKVIPIPIGTKPLIAHLEKLQASGIFLRDRPVQVLLMGLAGSLKPNYSIGDVVIYQDCVYKSNPSSIISQNSDRQLTTLLGDHLLSKAQMVTALTSDRLIWSKAEKLELGQIADVVDMEGFPILEILGNAGMAVATIRVISDDVFHNLPDLTSAIAADGSLKSWPLAMGMLRQPLAAARLIQGAIYGLKVLRQVTSYLFTQKNQQ